MKSAFLIVELDVKKHKLVLYGHITVHAVTFKHLHLLLCPKQEHTEFEYKVRQNVVSYSVMFCITCNNFFACSNICKYREWL